MAAARLLAVAARIDVPFEGDGEGVEELTWRVDTAAVSPAMLEACVRGIESLVVAAALAEDAALERQAVWAADVHAAAIPVLTRLCGLGCDTSQDPAGPLASPATGE
jgi:hypothetical protein